MIRLKIADIVIQLNMQIKLLHDNLYDYLYKGASEADIIWDFIFDNSYKIDEKPYIVSKEYNIYYENNKIVYKFNSDSKVPFMIVANADFSEVKFYLPKRFENLDKCTNLTIINAKKSLYSIFRDMFILACIYKERLPMHAATVVYEGKGYMFSASSSEGKSTHAELWEKLYCCEMLNEDLCVVGMVDTDDKKEIVVYGCPWSEKSNNSITEQVLLGGMAFIKKGKENIIFDIGKEELGMNLLESHFVPMLTKEIADICVKNICNIARSAKGYKLACNKDKEAAIKAFEYMV